MRPLVFLGAITVGCGMPAALAGPSSASSFIRTLGDIEVLTGMLCLQVALIEWAYRRYP